MEKRTLREKFKKWWKENFHILMLGISIFLSSYFSVITRYNLNTILNSQKRGYFGFLFTNLQLKKRIKSGNGVPYFAFLLLISFIMGGICKTMILLFQEKIKRKIEREKIQAFSSSEEIIDSRNISLRAFDEFAFFFSICCDLFNEIWAAIVINIKRSITRETWRRSLICVILLILFVQAIEGMLKVVNDKDSLADKNDFLSYLLTFQLEKKQNF